MVLSPNLAPQRVLHSATEAFAIEAHPVLDVLGRPVDDVAMAVASGELMQVNGFRRRDGTDTQDALVCVTDRCSLAWAKVI